MMQLQRIRVEQLRQFRQPFELAGLDPGLNLLAGPNEAGKSTLVRAIRAAFFERVRSTSMDDLLPWGEPSAAPSVEIDFTIDGVPHQLRKRFLHRKRCLLDVGSRQLEGDDAEQHLAELLGFRFAAKGASKPEHWGVPGLLWIEQGQAHDIHQPVGHATDHLRQALARSVTEVASSQGDSVIARVRKEREALLTQAGKPRGVYQEALAEQDTLGSRLAELDGRITHYRQQVDRLGELLQLQAQEAADKPWEALLAQQRQAQAQLDALQAEATQLETDRNRLRQLEDKRQLLQLQRERFDADARALTQRQDDLARAEQRLAEARTALARWDGERAAAQQASEAADTALLAAQQHQRRVELQRQLQEARTQATALQDTLAQARQEQAQLQQLRAQAAEAVAPASDDIALLRQQHQQLGELRIREQAVATRLQFELLPGIRATLDGQALAGSGELLVKRAATLDIADVGQLRIVPGGADLAELAREETRLAAAHQADLQRVGAADLADAERRHGAAAQTRSDIALATRTLALRAPQGLDALQDQLDTLTARAGQAERALAQLPADDAGAAAPTLPVADAEARLAQARARLKQATQQFDAANLAAGAAQTQRDAAERESAALQATLSDPARAQLARTQAEQLHTAQAECQALEQAIAAREQALARQRADILQQDVARFGRSAQQAQQQFDERRSEIRVVQGMLEDAGAHGLEEERARGQLELQAVQRRCEQLQLRAAALDLLLGRLESHRRALTQRLQAPLQKHVQHYLPLLFTQAQLDIGDDLAPGRLTRADDAGATQAGPVTELSFGAREQMGVISRLAYADLLREAGRPTLIILDDALVHSDAQRLAQMKRVLFDAAQRHQVLLFTCHPESWRDLGAPARAIAAARPAAAG
ncbi:MAG: AAA family ATPase [Burkholderiaceae bacterium]